MNDFDVGIYLEKPTSEFGKKLAKRPIFFWSKKWALIILSEGRRNLSFLFDIIPLENFGCLVQQLSNCGRNSLNEPQTLKQNWRSIKNTEHYPYSISASHSHWNIFLKI